MSFANEAIPLGLPDLRQYRTVQAAQIVAARTVSGIDSAAKMVRDASHLRRPAGTLDTLEIPNAAPIEYVYNQPPNTTTDTLTVPISGFLGEYPDAAMGVLHDEGMPTAWVQDRYLGRTATITDRPMVIDQKGIRNALMITHLVRKFGFSKVNLVGHSMGGGIAAAVTELLDPDIELDLTSPPSWKDRFPSLAARFHPSSALADAFLTQNIFSDDLPTIGSLTICNSPTVLTEQARGLRAIAQRGRERPLAENLFTYLFVGRHPLQGGREIAANTVHDVVPRLTRLRDMGMPVEVTVGENDHIVPPTLVQPAARARIVPGEHCSIVDDPALFHEHVVQPLQAHISTQSNTV